MKPFNIILPIIIIVLTVILETILKQRKKTQDKETNNMQYPYKRKMLLTKSEYVFYNILKEKCDKENLIICPKVRMEDFLQVTDTKNTLKYRGYIKSKHIDFILCDNKLHILAGIELDDNTHNNANVQKKDEFKNEVFKTIQLPLFRIKTTYNTYDEQIQNMLNELLHKTKN